MDIIKKLVQIEGSNLHIVETDKKQLNKFIEELQDNLPSNTYLAIINGSEISTLDELFKLFCNVFEFPDYFGENWAAFDECINDLDWLDASSYVLILKDIDVLFDEEYFTILIKTLCQAANEWINGRNYDDFPTPPKPFHIIFAVSLNNGEKIEEIITKEGFRNIEFLSL